MPGSRQSKMPMELRIQLQAFEAAVDEAPRTADEEDMRRMGKRQEFRVSALVLLGFCDLLTIVAKLSNVVYHRFYHLRHGNLGDFADVGVFPPYSA